MLENGTSPKNDRTLSWFIVLAAIAVAAFSYPVWPSWLKRHDLWFGNLGLFGLLGAGLTIYLLNRRTKNSDRQIGLALEQAELARLQVEMNRQTLANSYATEVATRFQKGVELLSSPNESSRIGGIFVLRDVALERPLDYHNSVVDMLAGFVVEQTRELADALAVAATPSREGPLGDAVSSRKRAAIEKSGTPTPRDAATAFEIIGELRAVHDNFVQENSRRKLFQIKGAALVDLQATGGCYSRMNIDDCWFGETSFRECTFDDAGLNIHQSGAVTLSDCSLVGTGWQAMPRPGNTQDQIIFTECDLGSASIGNRHAHVTALHCLLDGTTSIYGGSIDLRRCWTEAAFPHLSRPTGAQSEQDWTIYIVHKHGSWHTSPRGLQLYEPYRGQLPVSVPTQAEP